MKTLGAIKARLKHQQLRVSGNANALRVCAGQAREAGQSLLTHPASLLTSFSTGWMVVRLANRPKKIKQARNVTIKKPGVVRQLLGAVMPLVIASARTRSADASADVNANSPGQQGPQDPDSS